MYLSTKYCCPALASTHKHRHWMSIQAPTGIRVNNQLLPSPVDDWSTNPTDTHWIFFFFRSSSSIHLLSDPHLAPPPRAKDCRPSSSNGNGDGWWSYTVSLCVLCWNTDDHLRCSKLLRYVRAVMSTTHSVKRPSRRVPLHWMCSKNYAYCTHLLMLSWCRQRGEDHIVSTNNR